MLSCAFCKCLFEQIGFNLAHIHTKNVTSPNPPNKWILSICFAYVMLNLPNHCNLGITGKIFLCPAELEYKWYAKFGQKTSQVEEQRPLLVTEGYSWHRSRWVNMGEKIKFLNTTHTVMTAPSFICICLPKGFLFCMVIQLAFFL